MIRYLITTHGHLEGVRLSKPGHWGNVPYRCEEEARKAAEKDARGQRIKMERRDYPALSTVFAPEPYTR